MKKILVILFLLPWLSLAQHQGDWQTNYDKALRSAKSQNKNILVYFTGSDWCTPCKKLKTDLFDTQAFADVAKNYVLLYVDYPRNQDLLTQQQRSQNEKLLSKYNKKKVFPLLQIVNKKGRAIDQYSGYSMTGDVRYHLDFLKKNG